MMSNNRKKQIYYAERMLSHLDKLASVRPGIGTYDSQPITRMDRINLLIREIDDLLVLEREGF